MRLTKKAYFSICMVLTVGLFVGMLSAYGDFSVKATEQKSYKFQFGPAEAKEGYTQVLESTEYSASSGYGFADVSNISSVDRGEKGSSCFSKTAMNFNVDVPNGDYDITITVGDTEEATNMSIYINGASKYRDLKLEAGTYDQKTFVAAVIDGKMNFEFSGELARINSIEIIPKPERKAGEHPSIYIASDSTAQTYGPNDYPQAGWGQMLDNFFKSEVQIINKAIGGRSSKSFVLDGRLDNILVEIKPGDYLFVQFAHNDASSKPERFADANTTYKEYLKKYIDGAIQRKAIPVLITPVCRRSVDAAGKFKDDFPAYTSAMKQVAEENNVILLDLSAKSRAYFDTIGFEAAKKFYFWTEKGESVKWPDGTQDDTHFKYEGAYEVARLVSEEVRDKIPDLAKYLLDESEIKPFVAPPDPRTVTPTPTPTPTPVSTPAVDPDSFKDIQGHWAEEYIKRMVKEGLVKGKDEVSFAPEDQITRAEFLALALRAIGLEPVDYEDAYRDVTADQWYAGTVQAAFDAKLIPADMTPDNKFKADEPINREEMTSIIMAAYQYVKGQQLVQTEEMSFNDKDEISPWAFDDVKTAAGLGIIKGVTETEFAPKECATRAQAVVIISRLYDRILDISGEAGQDN